MPKKKKKSADPELLKRKKKRGKRMRRNGLSIPIKRTASYASY